MPQGMRILKGVPRRNRWKLIAALGDDVTRAIFLAMVRSKHSPAYFSLVAKRVRTASRRTVLMRLNELEKLGLVRSEWRTVNLGRPTYVRAFEFTDVGKRLHQLMQSIDKSPE